MVPKKATDLDYTVIIMSIKIKKSITSKARSSLTAMLNFPVIQYKNHTCLCGETPQVDNSHVVPLCILHQLGLESVMIQISCHFKEEFKFNQVFSPANTSW